VKNIIAYKSNALIEASYKLTLQEQRLLLVCIGKLNPLEISPDKTFQITSQEFFNAFPDMGRENAERDLISAIEKLWDRSIIIKHANIKEEFRWIQYKAQYLTGTGKAQITFSDAIIPYLSQLSGQFTKIIVKNVSRLSSSYSIRIYELLQQFKTTGNRKIQLDHFRSILDIQDKYRTFKSLNQLLLKPSIQELNEKSDLTVKVMPIKNGRKIIALDFSFSQDKSIKVSSKNKKTFK